MAKPRRAPKARSAARRPRTRAGARRPSLLPQTWRGRLVLLLLLLVAGAAAYFFWFRDSSLVAVTDVEVAGAASAEREAITSELTAISEEMSTLNFDRDRVAEAALAYPTVKAVDVDPNFPHGVRIEITERPPAVLARDGDTETAIAADGTVLAGIAVPEGEELPAVEVESSPTGKALEGEELDQAVVAGAVPEPLRPLIEKVSTSKEFGVEVTMRGGIPIRFGAATDAAAKWEAAATVLADPKLDTLTYLDVRFPERPAVGGQPSGDG